MIATITAAWLALRGDKEKYLDFLVLGLGELLVELLALLFVLEAVYG